MQRASVSAISISTRAGQGDKRGEGQAGRRRNVFQRGEMKKQDTDIIERSVEFWRRRTGKEYSREDVRGMMANVAGFFKVLDEWDRAEREERKETQGPGKERSA